MCWRDAGTALLSIQGHYAEDLETIALQSVPEQKQDVEVYLLCLHS